MIKLYYGYKNIPDEDGKVHGGLVKFQRLQRIFPNSLSAYNILYLGSSSTPVEAEKIVDKAKAKGAKFVWNQNGVGHGAWAPDWQIDDFEKKINLPMRKLLHKADFVIYQSEFAKKSADIFLGKVKNDFAILHNACDTDYLKPMYKNIIDGKTIKLLLGGTQYHIDKFDTAVKTLKILIEKGIKVYLFVAGKICWPTKFSDAFVEAEKILTDYEVSEYVKFLGFHSQKEIPRIYTKSNILIHPTFNDVCPGTVIEAMSCGLPVVYSVSGGVSEIVGKDGGIGIPAPESFKEYIVPNPEEMAEAIIKIADNLQTYSEAARKRAVEKFDFKNWVKAHREIFDRLLN